MPNYDDLIIEGTKLVGVKNKNITEVTIPNFITKIGYKAFACCFDLETVVIPDSVDDINIWAFYACISLTKITIPSSVSHIQPGAFQNCASLTSVTFQNPQRVHSYLSSDAFKNCHSLADIKIEITNVYCSNLASLLNMLLINDCRHPKAMLTKTKNGFILNLSKNQFKTFDENSKSVKNILLANYYAKFFEDERKLETLDNIPTVFSNYQYYKDSYKLNQHQEIDYNEIFNYNFKSLKNLMSSIINKKIKFPTLDDEENFYKLCDNIGVLNSEPITMKTTTKSGKEKIQTIDYSQKAREFLKDRILDGSLPLDQFYTMFVYMHKSGFKQGFADFFLNKNNFDELMAQERNQPGFIAKCYNAFEKAQSAHTSHRGNQRQLAPTVEFFKTYFIEEKYTGITDETRKIAETISPYFLHQHDFDQAVKIDSERKEKGVADNILDDEYIKEEDVFERVDSLLKEIKDISIDTASTLVDLANRKFTYEFLYKSDPLNFVLGKLCSCCAHLAGEGNGIMHASIVHPDVQNIVIRNKMGTIVAKSTLYVNREECYGVCNNVEVNDAVNDKDKKLIYKKFKKAIEVFAEKYNNKYPDKPLRIINVGMHANDLYDEITENDIQSHKLYKALDYGKYAYDGSNYNGDSADEQYTIWHNPELIIDETI